METAVTHIMETLYRERKVDKRQLNEEAYRLYFNLHPELKLEGVITLYQQGDISLSRAAELLGITVPEFKEVLATRGIVRETEGKSTNQIDEKIREIFAL
jgi:predicted HTH domain antitoxin